VIFITAMDVRDSTLPQMNGERIPGCPSCGAPMRFVRAISQADGLAELQTYDCKDCGVAVTEAAPQLASTAASDRPPIIGAFLSHGLLVSSPDPQPVPTGDEPGTASSRRGF